MNTKHTNHESNVLSGLKNIKQPKLYNMKLYYYILHNIDYSQTKQYCILFGKIKLQHFHYIFFNYLFIYCCELFIKYYETLDNDEYEIK